jgi:thiol-disulfide isomerase/thioredoxin
MKNVNAETCKSIIKNHPFVVIKFGAGWCEPCKSVTRYLKELAPTYPQIEFLELDVDSDLEFAVEMEVRAIPAILFAINGEFLKDNKGGNEKVTDIVGTKNIINRFHPQAIKNS